MHFFGLDIDFQRLDAPLPIFLGTPDAAAWSALAAAVASAGGEIVSLWGDDRGADGLVVCAAYRSSEGLLIAELPLRAQRCYPDIAVHLPAANRMQRAARDLVGIEAEGAADTRPWLRHDAWPADYHPLAAGVRGDEHFEPHHAPYPFVTVSGEGVHEIPVGPVHAGIIEPGHFRFSVVGEKVLRLEQRLGYTHKGIERRFVGMALPDGARLAGRISGDSTVAYAWAYAMAAESIAGLRAPERARWLRAILLERERVANHLGDLGALGNDAAFAFALTQFALLREDWQRTSGAVFGHRLLMDTVVPGGVAGDIDAAGVERLRAQVATITEELAALRTVFNEHAGLQDRLVTTGRVPRELATRLGLTGMAGRASGIARDLRADFQQAPYDRLDCRCRTQRGGDVAARVDQRFDETFDSLAMLEQLLTTLPSGEIRAEWPSIGAGVGIGCVEGWRGPVLVALRTGFDGRLARAHCHDPSWQNWPALEHAVIGNIVADFPLINKSFNLSYSGQDL